MVFVKYPDIERLGHEDNKDILAFGDDPLVVEEKVDGGCGCCFLEEDSIHVASRNRDLLAEGDAKTFAKQRLGLLKILEGKKLNPDYLYYFEWMAPHTIHYTNAPDVVGFDIRLKHSMEEGVPGLFLGRDSREAEFSRLGIENIPIVWRGKVKDFKRLEVFSLIPKSKYYDGKAEGIVIKNYFRKSKFGNHQLYAKVVCDEFKENNKAVFGGVKNKVSDTFKIAEQFATDARIKKIILKQVNEFNQPLDMRLMQVVPSGVVKDILKEEFVEIFSNYSFIDFRELKGIVTKKCVLIIQGMMIEKSVGKSE